MLLNKLTIIEKCMKFMQYWEINHAVITNKRSFLIIVRKWFVCARSHLNCCNFSLSQILQRFTVHMGNTVNKSHTIFIA